MTSDAQRRANQKQDAARAGKRVQFWLDLDDAKALDILKRRWKMESRISVLRHLLEIEGVL